MDGATGWGIQSSKKGTFNVKGLSTLDPRKPIVVIYDTSPYGMGAVLAHRIPSGEERPIAFVSRTLTEAENNYAQIDKEGLALIFAVKKFHNYVLVNRS